MNIPDSGSDPASSMFRGTILDTLIAIDAEAGRAVVRSRTADHVTDEAVDVVDGRYTVSFLHRSVGHLLSYAQPSISVSRDKLLALARAHISEFRAFDLKTAPATGLALGILYVSGRSLHNLAAVDRTELMTGGGSQYGRYRRHFDYLLDMRS
ncbi:hypothetical protein JJJ17_06695 [Paracoccus caeni]|uniref:Uncharacterized protein n=1 Tax=Paracoccus caeni TaxID=657651 RepID=A0A934SJK1_9RHOB|nr:hypothetical protein [Paracoccus caeni]MBK4215608.1 hypothetical protein [Paracoccus caeni]